MISNTVFSVVGSLLVAGITACVALLWHSRIESAVMRQQIAALEARFSDFTKYMELLLERIPHG